MLIKVALKLDFTFISFLRDGKGCSFNILVASPMEIFRFEKRMSQR
jgi:hypothetical protein